MSVSGSRVGAGRVPRSDGRSLLRVLAALAMVLVLASCGGIGGGGKVSAAKWSKDVCGTIKPWTDDIKTSMGSFQSAVDPSADPATVKTKLTKSLGDAVTATDKALKGVGDAGTPDVKDGAKIVKDFKAALKAARDAFAKAKKGIEAISTSDKSKFLTDLSRVATAMGTDVQGAGKKVDALKSTELKKAFDKEKSCKAVGV